MAERPTTILFGGDCHFGDKVLGIDDRLRTLIRNSSGVVVNQESPITEIGQPALDKEIYLRSSPRAVAGLQALGVKVASLANNHIADYAQKGLEDTIARLAAAGIATVGAGSGPGEASAPAHLTLPDGRVIAFLAFTSPAIGSTVADERSYGCCALDPRAVEQAVARARKDVAHVVLLLHYGLTNFDYPPPDERRLVRSFARLGADLVIGHHPHVVQGHEILEGTPIFYSLGNLIFASYQKRGKPVALSASNRRGALVAVAFSPHGVDVEDVIFTDMSERDDHLLLTVAGSPDAARRSFDLKSRHLAAPSYESFFKRYAMKRLLRRVLLWTSPARWRTFSGAQLRSLWLSLSYAVGPRK